MSGSGRLAGKVAIVTGAGGGIGYAYAERFLREGAKVLIGEINAEAGEAAAAGLAELGDVAFQRTDVADPDSTRECAAAADERFGRVDILVNNAALYGDMAFGDQSFGYLKRVFDVNLHSVWLMTQAVAPYLVRSGAGRVINQASGAAYNYRYTGTEAEFEGLSNYSYSQTKWGVVGLTKYLAGQLGRWGTTVNCIAPGVIMTDATLKKVPGPILERLGDEQALRGSLTADDLTGAAVFFASEDAKFISGQVLVVDGGRHMPA